MGLFFYIFANNDLKEFYIRKGEFYEKGDKEGGSNTDFNGNLHCICFVWE